MLDSWRI